MKQKYKKFTDVEEARMWGREYYSYWLPRYQLGGELRYCYELENIEWLLSGNFTLKESEQLKRDALENKWFSFYCGGNYGLALNQKLREGDSIYCFPEEDFNEMQQVMDFRLEQSKIPENVLGYRFVKYKDLCRSINKKHIMCGMIIQDKGYMGVGLIKTALIKEWGSYDTLLKILIPQGAKGLYIDLVSNRPKEQEVLFARNSKLKVLFQYRHKGKRVLICRMII